MEAVQNIKLEKQENFRWKQYGGAGHFVPPATD